MGDDDGAEYGHLNEKEGKDDWLRDHERRKFTSGEVKKTLVHTMPKKTKNSNKSKYSTGLVVNLVLHIKKPS
jgi:hypothetical protein